MKTYRFKTNINCNGCINTVKPALDNDKIAEWEVDITNPDKILKVITNSYSAEDIVSLLKEKGYTAQSI